MAAKENQFFIDSEYLSPEALERKHRLETDPSVRKDHMEYLPGMEQIESDVRENVMSHMNSYDASEYTAKDVQAALEHETCSIEDFKALLSPAAEPFLERMAQRARLETSKHFGNTVYLFTPLYIANYCENYCVYCGFNCYNHINRMKLTPEQYLLFERKQFEFGFLPKRFFEQGKQMMDDLCEKKEEYVDQFFEECYQQKRMYPYLPEEFSVMVMNISQELLIVRVDLPPRDMGVPSCFRVYFAWNDVEQSGRYFTIERTQDPGRHLLGEFQKDWKHVDYGQAPAEGAELQKIIDICTSK